MVKHVTLLPPANIHEIQETILWCHTHHLPCSILGAGSNSVYSDEEFQGVVLSLENLSKWFWETDGIFGSWCHKY